MPPPPVPTMNGHDKNNHHMQQHNGQHLDKLEESTNKKYGRKVRKLLKQSTKYAEQKHLKFFILDCRSLEEYEAGHLPCAFWVDPSLDVSSEQLREKLKSLLEMKGCHFVLFFDGRHNSSDQLLLNNNDPLSIQQQDAFAMMNRANEMEPVNPSDMMNEQQLFRQSLLYFFLEKKTKYVSICESGYAGCHELIVGNLELIDHATDRCIECNGKWKSSLLSSVKGRFNSLISVAGGSMEKLRNKMVESRHHQHAAPHHQHQQQHHKEKAGGAHSTGHSPSTHSPRMEGAAQSQLVLTNNYDPKPIEAEHARNIHLCSNSPLLMIYLSILRDRETKNVDRFQEVTHKVLVLMFSQILDRHLELFRFDSCSNYSPLDISYGSIKCQRGIYGVCLNDSCEHALKNLLSSFQPVIRSVVGTLKVEESFVEDEDGIIRSNRQAVALMPKDIDERIVVIFCSIINQQTANNELQSAIDALLKLGAKQQNIMILCLIASRLSLVALLQKFKSIHIWCACIDAVNSHNSSKLIPGIGVFQHRYKFRKPPKTQKTKKSLKRKKNKKQTEKEDEDGNHQKEAAIEQKEDEVAGSQPESMSDPDPDQKSKKEENEQNEQNDENDQETKNENVTAPQSTDSDDHDNQNQNENENEVDDDDNNDNDD